MNTFYNHNYMALLLTPVRTAVTMVRKDLAQRLWNGSFDIPIVGMLLHPYLHRCEAPNGMTHQQLLEDDGRGIAKFFFSDFLQRGTAAFWRVVERLGIHQDDVQNAVPEQQGAPAPRRFSFVPSSLAVVNGNFQTPQAELAAFLETSPIDGISPIQFWSGHQGDRFPFLRKVARAVFVVPVTSASAERAWSLADDISGGRSRLYITRSSQQRRFVEEKRKGVGANQKLLIVPSL
jgi:hypothetical protein